MEQPITTTTDQQVIGSERINERLGPKPELVVRDYRKQLSDGFHVEVREYIVIVADDETSGVTGGPRIISRLLKTNMPAVVEEIRSKASEAHQGYIGDRLDQEMRKVANDAAKEFGEIEEKWIKKSLSKEKEEMERQLRLDLNETSDVAQTLRDELRQQEIRRYFVAIPEVPKRREIFRQVVARGDIVTFRALATAPFFLALLGDVEETERLFSEAKQRLAEAKNPKLAEDYKLLCDGIRILEKDLLLAKMYVTELTNVPLITRKRDMSEEEKINYIGENGLEAWGAVPV